MIEKTTKKPFAKFRNVLHTLIPKELPLQAKVLKFTSLATILGCFFGLMINLSLQMPWNLNLVILFCLLGTIWLFFRMPLYDQYNRSGLMLLMIAHITLALNWFPNGGSHASTPYFMMMLICIAALILTGIYLWVTVGISISMMISLVLLEDYFPQWLPTPTDPWQAKLDILVAVIFVSLLLAWLVSFMIKIYKQQFERAETANYAKTLFLSQLSHELRTPLNSVIGFSGQLIEKGERLKPVQQKLFAETIRKNGAHLLALVNQVIDLSLIETGKLELFWQEVNVNQILKEIEDVVALDAQHKHLAYHLNLSEPDIYVQSDPHRLRQILINLINNAIKYTPHGSVSCLVNPQAEGVQIDIQDTGPGIPVDQQKLIFEPFVRLETHREIQGNGIGLTITQTLCQHLGCKLFLKNSSQAGSTFSVFIPYEH